MPLVTEEVVNLLRKWECEEYVDRFERERICKVSTLHLLTESSVERLFPEEGLKLEFWRNLMEWRQSPQVEPIQTTTTETTRAATTVNLITEEDSSSDGDDNNGGELGGEFGGEGSVPKKQRVTGPNDLLNTLKDHIKGKLVLSFFEEHGQLQDSMRKILGEIIISSHLAHDVNRSLSAETCKHMFKQLKEIFPTERQELWLGNLGNGEGRGKLLSSFYNLRRTLARCGLITPKPTSAVLSVVAHPLEDDFADMEKVADDLLWLKNSKVPWTRVVELWRETSRERIRSLLNENIRVHEYMDSYPALKDKSGYLLLELDFEILHPESTMRLYSEWPKLLGFLNHKLPQKHKERIQESFSADGKKLSAVLALSYLFPVVSAVRKGKAQWRPSRQEAMESLILVVQTNADIQRELQSRREKYEKFNLQLGPQAVVVGDTDLPSQCYVVINNLTYEVESPLKSLDITFKARFALDSPYPKESAREWIFLQRAVYGVETAHDKPLLDARTTALIAEYKDFS